MMDARSGLEPMAAEKFLEGTQNLIDTHLRPAGHDAFIRLSAYFSDSERAKESMRAFSQFDVEGNGHISPKDFVKYITNLPLENAIAKADPTPKEVSTFAQTTSWEINSFEIDAINARKHVIHW